MRTFAALILEINCYKYDPLVKILWSRAFNWERQSNKAAQAGIWLHVASDERGKQRILANLEASCVKLCAPIGWNAADKLLHGIKSVSLNSASNTLRKLAATTG